MNALVVIKNVRGYQSDNGIPQLNLEDVARGLGFVEIKNNIEYVRYRTVRGYLKEVGFATSCENDELPEYIPENIFYKLCFKAKNEVARKFQDLVTDEVLPSIRKHGAYLTEDKIEEVLSNPDTIIKLAMGLKEERKRRVELQKTVDVQRPKVLFADSVESSQTSILIGDLAKILKQSGHEIGQNRLFKWLRENDYLIKNGERKNMPTQKAMELKLFEVKERTVNNPDGSIRITKTTKVTGKGQIYFVEKFKMATDTKK